MEGITWTSIVEIPVLSNDVLVRWKGFLKNEKKCMCKGERMKPPHTLRRKGSILCCQNTMLIADIKRHHGPVMIMTTLPASSFFKETVILILQEHQSDNSLVFTYGRMEILTVSSSNCIACCHALRTFDDENYARMANLILSVFESPYAFELEPGVLKEFFKY
ncbi:hypothetical protein Tco_0703990 [Tanacetum coccineum]|uniref:Uncharacterized protein n=1 Tax=Tanacetum coccineum TaxID=301880 RepID=A0ABQ4Y0W8_9ASTR